MIDIGDPSASSSPKCAQGSHDASARRLELLSRFAMECGSAASTDDVLRVACAALEDALSLHAPRAFRVAGEECDDAHALLVSSATMAFLASASTSEATRSSPADLLTALKSAHPPAGDALLLVPIGEHGGARTWVLAGRRDVAHPEPAQELSPEQCHFAGLIARLAGCAISSVRAKADAVQKQQEIELANRGLRHAAARFEERLVSQGNLEAIGRLTGGVAHDFNNLLAIILTHAQFVAESAGLDAQAREDLGHVKTAAQRAADITSQLLALARRQRTGMRSVDVHALIEADAPLLNRIVGSRHALERELMAPQSVILADRTEIAQAIMNLVLNARDASPDGGRLTIRTRAPAPGEVPAGERRWLAVDVIDFGVGMNDATRERIFEPLFSTKTGGQGTGLGLVVTRAAVEAADGKISVRSKPGEGTTFTLLFPTLEVARMSVVPNASLPPPALSAHVLVVDDEPAMRAATARILRAHGYAVLEASNGPEALALTQHCAIDLIVTDVVMPTMSGVELVANLRKRGQNANAIFVSGFATDAELQGETFIRKPFAPGALLKEIHAVLRKERGSASNAPKI